MRSVKEEVAKNLLFYRKKNKITQKMLAETLGVSHNTISQWESGTNSIEAELLFRICETFGISVNDMYGSYSNAQSEQYTRDEKIIIENYCSLNIEGKKKIIDYIDDLVSSGKYIGSHETEYGEDVHLTVTDDEISKAEHIAKMISRDIK